MQAPSGGDILLFHRMLYIFYLAAKYGRDGDYFRLFDEDLLDSAIVEDEDIQTLLEGGLAMAVG